MPDDTPPNALLEEDARGVSDTLGFILLTALIVTAAGVTLGFGATAVEQTKGVSETQQAENAFAELDSRASAVALGEGPNQRTIDLGLNNQQRANVEVQRDARITILSSNMSNGNTTVVMNRTIGTLVYQRGNTEIAYQSGGVWKRDTATGTTQLVTPPEVQYRDATLTMPLVTIANDPGHLGTDRITVAKEDSFIPKETRTPVKSRLVTVQIQSEYYKAWGDYFENHVSGNVTTTYYHHNNTVSIDLGLAGTILGEFNSAIVANGDVDTQGGGEINGPVVSSGDISGNVDGHTMEDTSLSLFQLDPHIEAMIQEAQRSYTDLGTINSSTELKKGRYYADEVNLEKQESLKLKAATGNITLVVDGDITLENNASIHVNDNSSKNSHARVLTDGDFTLGTGAPEVTTSNGPEDFQLYGSSETDILISQHSTFEGVIYAPSDKTSTNGGNLNGNGGGSKCKNMDYDVCIGSEATVEGAIVGGSTRVGQDAELNYDSDLASFSPSVAPKSTIRPRLVHLQVSINNVSLTEAR